MIREITEEDIAPFFSGELWHDKNEPVASPANTDQAFFDTLGKVAKRMEGTPFMDAFRFGSSEE